MPREAAFIGRHTGVKVTHRLRTFEACIVLLSAGAAVLLSTAQSVFVGIPLIPYSCTLVLFLVPGAVLVRWFFHEHISGLAALPVWFALSVGIFDFIGVPFLILHQDLASYLWVASAVVVAFLVAAVVKRLRRGEPAESDGVTPDGYSFNWLWIPFLSMGVLLISIS